MRACRRARVPLLEHEAAERLWPPSVVEGIERIFLHDRAIVDFHDTRDNGLAGWCTGTEPLFAVLTSDWTLTPR